MELGLNPLTLALTTGTVTGLEAVAQRVRLRCSRLFAEWFLDLESGLPTEVVGSRGTPLPVLQSRIRAEIEAVAGVLSAEVRLSLNALTRRLTITTKVRAVDGTIEVTV